MKLAISKNTLALIISTVTAAAILILFSCDPIIQDTTFHHFADTRNFLSVNNFWNTASNLPFFLLGITGLQKIHSGKCIVQSQSKSAYNCFFTAILLVSFGSAYYHFNPDNSRLMWDRLPMTIAFMSLLSIGIAEFFSIRPARTLLVPLIGTGIASIAWWQYNGDLRLYALVQFLSILLLILLFIFGRRIYNTNNGYVGLFVFYAAAKLCEFYDAGIYKITGGLIAGHLLKHLLIAAGLWYFLLYLQQRKSLLTADLRHQSLSI